MWMPPGGTGRVIVITGGAMAAGKSTVAQLLAQRLPQSVHVRGGDAFRRMMINGGGAEMTPESATGGDRPVAIALQAGLDGGR